MGLGGIVKWILRRVFQLTIFLTLLVIIPYLPPKVKIEKSIRITPSKPLTGKLSLNNRLDEAEVWHQGDFVGPEGFADLNGELYTSLYSGDIVKLTGNHITPVAKFGKPCKNAYEEKICGRPLGLTFDKSDGTLYAVDAYYGIFQVDVTTGKKKQLVSPKTAINGITAKIFNSIALASNGDFYWTDSSTNFTLQDGLFVMLADPTGRLIHYNAKTKENTVLIDGINFANGVALSEDEEFVIVAETAGSRILRYYLKGPKKGTHDVFIDGLPGLPDNLKADGKGGFLVPLIIGRDEEHPVLSQSIAPFPLIRKAVARLMGSAKLLFQTIDKYYPNEVSLKVVHYIGHFTSLPKKLNPRRVTILRVNRKGEITDSVHTTTGKIEFISEAHVLKDILYLGSPFNDYIAKIPLAKLGWDDLRQEERAKRAAPVDTPKPTTTPKPSTTTTTTTPKPTTTTPKPTTTTAKPATTTTTTPRPTTTPKPTTTTPKPTTTTPKPVTTTKPQTTPPPKQTPPQAKPTNPPKQTAPPVKQTPPPAKQTTPPVKQAPPATQERKQAKPQEGAQRKQN